MSHFSNGQADFGCSVGVPVQLTMDTTSQAPIRLSFSDVEALLVPLVQDKLQACNGGAADAAGSAEAAQEPADLGPMLATLQKLIASYTDGMGQCDVPGIPLPEVDEQLAPLQQEVEAVLQRLAGHRKHVPAVMAAALEQQLNQMRPAADLQSVPDQAAVGGDAAPDDGQQLDQAQQLHQSLKTALNKLPALRARLEEMDARLGPNLAAVAEAQSKAAQPPRTVERLLRGRSVVAGP